MKYFTLRILQELPLARALEFLARSYRARRDTRHLATFNDYLLRDIGITRDDIRGDHPS
jgi:uncharacterized protein YjiS (DUF1127 family)